MKKDIKKELTDFYKKFRRYHTVNLFSQMMCLSSGDKFMEFVLSKVKDDMTVLEVGSSSGIMAMETSRLTKFSVGVDISPSACKLANKLKKIEYERYKLIEDFENINLNSTCILNTRFIATDTEKLPFKDESFDLIFSKDTLEHIPNYLSALDEIERCLKKGGMLILNIPTPKINMDLDIRKWYKRFNEMDDKDAVSRIPSSVIYNWISRKNVRIINMNISYDSDRYVRKVGKLLKMMENRGILGNQAMEELKKFEPFETNIFFVGEALK